VGTHPAVAMAEVFVQLALAQRQFTGLNPRQEAGQLLQGLATRAAGPYFCSAAMVACNKAAAPLALPLSICAVTSSMAFPAFCSATQGSLPTAAGFRQGLGWPGCGWSGQSFSMPCRFRQPRPTALPREQLFAFQAHHWLAINPRQRQNTQLEAQHPALAADQVAN